jgi:hypothetical protein
MSDATEVVPKDLQGNIPRRTSYQRCHRRLIRQETLKRRCCDTGIMLGRTFTRNTCPVAPPHQLEAMVMPLSGLNENCSIGASDRKVATVEPVQAARGHRSAPCRHHASSSPARRPRTWPPPCAARPPRRLLAAVRHRVHHLGRAEAVGASSPQAAR